MYLLRFLTAHNPQSEVSGSHHRGGRLYPRPLVLGPAGFLLALVITFGCALTDDRVEPLPGGVAPGRNDGPVNITSTPETSLISRPTPVRGTCPLTPGWTELTVPEGPVPRVEGQKYPTNSWTYQVVASWADTQVLYAVGATGWYRNANCGDTWIRGSLPNPQMADVRMNSCGMAVAELQVDGGDGVYIRTCYQGANEVYFKALGKLNWSRMGLGCHQWGQGSCLKLDPPVVSPVTQAVLYAAAWNVDSVYRNPIYPAGLVRSDDYGQTWHRVNEKVQGAVYADPKDANAVYVVDYRPFGSERVQQRSTDGGHTFVEVAEVSLGGRNDPQHIVTSSDWTRFWRMDQDGTLAVSRDRGLHWEALLTPGDLVSWSFISASPIDPEVLLVTSQGRVWAYRDSGGRASP
jgi:hypothetical protein